MANIEFSLPVTVEEDRFGTNFHEESITGDTSEGGHFWCMISFDQPRIAIRYTRPGEDSDVVTQSVSVLDLMNAWVQNIEKELRQ